MIEVCNSSSIIAPLLDDGRELPDALALLAKHVLGAGGADDDLSAKGRHAHLHTCVSLLRELLGKKLATARDTITFTYRWCYVSDAEARVSTRGKRLSTE